MEETEPRRKEILALDWHIELGTHTHTETRTGL